MKKGMAFVMLTLFGSCVYTGTFFYLNLIEDSEGMSVHFLFASLYFILSSLRFRSSVRDKDDIYLNDSVKPPPFKCFRPFSSVHHCGDKQ